jgi:hypothetical protein
MASFLINPEVLNDVYPHCDFISGGRNKIYFIQYNRKERAA